MPEPWESGWLTRTVVVTDYVPLIGFASSEELIPLPDGYVLRRMTDQEIDAAITRGAVPTRDPSNPGRVTVSRSDQWALVHEETVPVIAGPREEAPTYLGHPVAEMDSGARRLIMTLRIVIGGSVLATVWCDAFTCQCWTHPASLRS